MMKYAILIYRDEQRMAAMTEPEIKQTMAAYIAYTQALREAGAFVTGAPLERSTTATTVQVRDGKREVQDGPYADAKEQLGGFFIIEAADLDAALEWAARCPGAQLGILEVRPVMSISEPTQ